MSAECGKLSSTAKELLGGLIALAVDICNLTSAPLNTKQVFIGWTCTPHFVVEQSVLFGLDFLDLSAELVSDSAILCDVHVAMSFGETASLQSILLVFLDLVLHGRLELH